MKIIEMKLTDLKPYEKNPRKNDNAVKYVAKSIEKFGFKVPIVIDKNNVIVCGHTRWKAAKRLKYKTVPCIIADDLTDEQIKAFRLADNRVQEMAEWDNELLSEELGELVDWDMTDFGFKFDEIGEDEPKQVEEDDFDVDASIEKNGKTDIVAGDIFLLGEHRLLCGSSTSADDIARLMDGQHAHMLFTSPPYSDLRNYEGGKDLSTDNLSNFLPLYKEYCDIQIVNLGLLFKDNEIFPYWNDYIDKAHASGLKLLAWNIWDKMDVGSIGMKTHMFPVRHEWLFAFGEDEIEDEKPDFTFVFGEKPEKTNKTWLKKDRKDIRSLRSTRQQDGSIRYSTVGDTSSKYKKMESVVHVFPEKGKIRSKHPAVFPVKLPAEYIQAVTKENEIVIEPFCGSGTTLIACEQLGRKCYAMELEPKYVAVIVDRWEQLTGRKAVKLDGRLR